MYKETEKQTRKIELTQKKIRKVELAKKKTRKGETVGVRGGTCTDLLGLDTDSDFDRLGSATGAHIGGTLTVLFSQDDYEPALLDSMTATMPIKEEN
jgi:hypothetical protein